MHTGVGVTGTVTTGVVGDGPCAAPVDVFHQVRGEELASTDLLLHAVGSGVLALVPARGAGVVAESVTGRGRTHGASLQVGQDRVVGLGDQQAREGEPGGRETTEQDVVIVAVALGLAGNLLHDVIVLRQEEVAESRVHQANSPGLPLRVFGLQDHFR